MAYEHRTVEPKWQARWREAGLHKTPSDPAQAEVLRARHVPVPVGRGPARRPPRGLHRDRHRRALQADARLQRAAPDGLGRVRPARRAVRDQDRHAPARHDRSSNIATFRRQLKTLGFTYDWDREVDTTDPGYYSWTQWIFLQLFERGLAYQAEVAGQLVPGARHRARQRGGHRRQERARRPPGRAHGRCGSGCCASPPTPTGCSRTSTALDWPESTQAMQRNWIGRSEGAEVDFAVDGHAGATHRASSPRGPTRCSARPTWCSRPSTRWSTS